MPSNIVIPSVGESITSGVIGRWNKKDGDTVNRDDIVLELETDKVTMEVRAESGGVLRHRAKQAGGGRQDRRAGQIPIRMAFNSVGRQAQAYHSLLRLREAPTHGRTTGPAAG